MKKAKIQSELCFKGENGLMLTCTNVTVSKVTGDLIVWSDKNIVTILDSLKHKLKFRFKTDSALKNKIVYYYDVVEVKR